MQCKEKAVTCRILSIGEISEERNKPAARIVNNKNAIKKKKEKVGRYIIYNVCTYTAVGKGLNECYAGTSILGIPKARPVYY